MVERLPSEAEIPFERLAAAPFPKLVVSGGHSAAFDAVCDVLEERLDAERLVVRGRRPHPHTVDGLQRGVRGLPGLGRLGSGRAAQPLVLARGGGARAGSRA